MFGIESQQKFETACKQIFGR